MKTISVRILFLILIALAAHSGMTVFAQQSVYYPVGGTWEKRSPEQLKIDAAKLKEAIDFAVSSEAKTPRDQELGQIQSFGREPFGEIIGPTKTRGEMTGIIVKNGYIVAEWGEPETVDMTHSVTKSFITAIVGLAFDRRMISDLRAPVYKQMAPISPFRPNEPFDNPAKIGQSKFLELFETDHSRLITWDDLLRQTSDWDGTLWGKPDWADRPDRDPSTWLTRKRNQPGTVFEYNDTRVNLLALCALNVWRTPLPLVLKDHIMDEIGASATWRWHGYENSFVIMDGQIMQSVSGGGHWGGGMFINSFDMARFGLLIARNGKWVNDEILSTQFLKVAETPTVPEPTYGFMNFYLNTEKKLFPSAPQGTIALLGNGTNIVFIDRANDIVIVARWIENSKIDEFLRKVYGALTAKS